MIFKENYFGGFNSWTNMEEFRKKYEAPVPSWGDPYQQRNRPGRVRMIPRKLITILTLTAFQSDKFEVNLDLVCRSGKIILPEDIYDCDGAVVIPVPLLQVHLRTHESLMRAYGI
jgi:hypothetical protein